MYADPTGKNPAAVTTCLGLILVDGPLPIGDIACGGVAAAALLYALYETSCPTGPSLANSSSNDNPPKRTGPAPIGDNNPPDDDDGPPPVPLPPWAGPGNDDDGGKPFALGDDRYLGDFANRRGAETYRDYDINNWQNVVMEKLLDPGQEVLFNVEGIGDPLWRAQKGVTNPTNGVEWELGVIKQNPALMESVQ